MNTNYTISDSPPGSPSTPRVYNRSAIIETVNNFIETENIPKRRLLSDERKIYAKEIDVERVTNVAGSFIVLLDNRTYSTTQWLLYNHNGRLFLIFVTTHVDSSSASREIYSCKPYEGEEICYIPDIT